MGSWKTAEGAQSEEQPAQRGALSDLDEASAPEKAPNAADFYRAHPALDRRVHIMGVGNVGSFIAHALRGIVNPPPVTLIFARWEKLNEWKESPQRLALVTDGDVETRDGFDAEIAIPRIRYHGKEVGLDIASADSIGGLQTGEPLHLVGESTEPIGSLIICSKAPYVLQGLSSVKHRLHKDSVILFLQNGMGVIQEVNREIFPDPATRPHYMLGINSHGVHMSPNAKFTTVHAGFGTMSLGILPHERDRDPSSPYIPDMKFTATKDQKPVSPDPPEQLNSDYPPPSSSKFRFTPNQRYLLRTLLRTPVLSATSFSPPDLLQMQLDKLAVNCIINPLTVLLDARNGSLLHNYALTRTIRLLLSEISLVIRSLPELQYIPNVSQRFDPGRLETVVIAVAHRTRDNVSSMLADVRHGVITEVDYINGWVVQRGEELGIRCSMNYMLVQMVKGKTLVVEREIAEGVPVVREKRKKGRGESALTVREAEAKIERQRDGGEGLGHGEEKQAKL